MGFETTIMASERATTVHALDRSATVTGTTLYSPVKTTDVSKQYVASIFRLCLFLLHTAVLIDFLSAMNMEAMFLRKVN
jgi:hypothetical protein